MSSIVGEIKEQMVGRKLSLATAESCTGGLVAHRLTNVERSSKFFIGGIVAYQLRVKAEMLRVSKELLDMQGAVNAETALQMAHGVRELFSTSVGISTTGVATVYDGEPRLRMFIAVATESTSGVIEINSDLHQKLNRVEIQKAFTEEALKYLLDKIKCM